MKDLRIAWLIPSIGRGSTGYQWQPVLKKFTDLFPDTVVYTSRFPGFAEGFEDSFRVTVIGKITKFADNPMYYGSGWMLLSFAILPALWQFKPQVLFVNAFSLWTVIVCIFKPFRKWKIILLYEGSSPNADFRDSIIRTLFRHWMTRTADAFITNTNKGALYLIDFLGAGKEQVFTRPYEVPTPELLLRGKNSQPKFFSNSIVQDPVFLYVGQIIERKGIKFLLEACKTLQEQGITNYKLLVGGDGLQKEELQAMTQAYHLSKQVIWLGWVDYESLGAYFKASDIFIFPSLEDTWGVVTLEAMTFGMPVLCSRLAGSSELVVDLENGFRFDPYDSLEMARLMKIFIDEPDLIQSMGKRSQELIAPHNAEDVSFFLAKVVKAVIVCSDN
jgi:glycosyltransferase involved in cell wall biosynthesis